MMISKKVYVKLETELLNVRAMDISIVAALADSMKIVYESLQTSKTNSQVKAS